MFIEDIYVFSERQDDVIVVFRGVEQIKIDGSPSFQVEKKGDSGNLLNISASDKEAEFLIEWMNVKTKKSEYCNYNIVFDEIKIITVKG